MKVFWGGIKCSITVLTSLLPHKKFTWPDFGRVYVPSIPPIATPLCQQSQEALNNVGKLKLKLNKALDENSSLSYGVSLAIFDHTVLPATQHKLTRSALTQPVSWYLIYLPQRDGKLS